MAIVKVSFALVLQSLFLLLIFLLLPLLYFIFVFCVPKLIYTITKASVEMNEAKKACLIWCSADFFSSTRARLFSDIQPRSCRTSSGVKKNCSVLFDISWKILSSSDKRWIWFRKVIFKLPKDLNFKWMCQRISWTDFLKSKTWDWFRHSRIFPSVQANWEVMKNHSCKIPVQSVSLKVVMTRMRSCKCAKSFTFIFGFECLTTM